MSQLEVLGAEVSQLDALRSIVTMTDPLTFGIVEFQVYTADLRALPPVPPNRRGRLGALHWFATYGQFIEVDPFSGRRTH